MADICHECENPAWTGKTIEAPALPSGGEGGTSNFNALENRPKYDGMRMTGNTDIPNTQRDVERLDGDITDIQELIPETASPENQLADKEFVNSSVATNTANFVGTFNSLEELEAVENPSNNDYGFVISTDEYGNTVYNRYKYVSSVESWEFEYALNNSSFTAAQWAAINSGITEGNVEKLNAILEITSIGNGLILENNGQLRQKLYTETGDNTDAAMDQKTTTEAIDGVLGRYRTLSAEDYNYDYLNTGENNTIALWLLSPGVYFIPQDVYHMGYKLGGRLSSSATVFVFKGNNDGNNGFVIAYGWNDGVGGEGQWGAGRLYRYGNTPGDPASGYAYTQVIMTDRVVKNDLNQTYAGYVLAAPQGKVLKEMIGTLSNLNTSAKTNAVAAINEVAGYKGQARKLTTDDYNWNHTTQTTTNPDCVNLSLLPPGLYYRESSAVVIDPYAYSASSGYLTFLVSKPDSSGRNNVLAISENTSFGWRIFPYINGRPNGEQQVILSRDITNNLTSTATNKALSAYQGKVLKTLIDGKQDELTEGNGIEIDNENVISIATISTEDWSALWQ